MEGKIVIMSALLVSLVLGQIQVEAKSCCPSTTARNIYNACRFAGGSRPLCASTSGCRIVDGKCPNGWNNDILGNTGDNAVNEYCKLGCVSSVCGAITTLQNSGKASPSSIIIISFTFLSETDKRFDYPNYAFFLGD
ncbi:hypothetical protein ACS0TY_022057 [Phlomoides rotata]